MRAKKVVVIKIRKWELFFLNFLVAELLKGNKHIEIDKGYVSGFKITEKELKEIYKYLSAKSQEKMIK